MDNGPSANTVQLVYFDVEAANLIAYIEGLGLPSPVEQALTRRLDLAADKFCNGFGAATIELLNKREVAT